MYRSAAGVCLCTWTGLAKHSHSPRLRGNHYPDFFRNLYKWGHTVRIIYFLLRYVCEILPCCRDSSSLFSSLIRVLLYD